MDILFKSKLFTVVRKYVKGRSGKELERHVILHPGAVTILPILEDGQVVLLKQYRVTIDDYLVELPAGTLDPEEEPIETARRELVEETGYTSTTLEKMVEFYSSPGILREKMTVFLATGLVAGPTDLEDGEDIQLFTVPLEEALRMVENAEITDGKTILALLWYHSRQQKRKHTAQTPTG